MSPEGGRDENKYTLELDWPEEVGVIVEALLVQRERWQDALMKKLAKDPSVSAIPLSRFSKASNDTRNCSSGCRTTG
jgi:hypothetical protein